MCDEQSSTRLLEDEYEIQHFNFSSTQFIAEFKDSIDFTIKSIHKDIEECTARKLELSNEKKKKLRLEIQTLTDIYAQETEKCLAKNEVLIRNFFKIPKNITLENDVVHQETADVNEKELINEIEEMKRQYIKEKTLSALYQQEINHIDRTSKLQQQIAKLIKQIDKMSDSTESLNSFNKLYAFYQTFIQKYETEYDMNLKKQIHLNIESFVK